MATQIQLRNDTAANWQSVDPILAVGEVGINTDTNTFKIGDGVSTWTELEYFAGDNSNFVPLPEFLDYVEGRSHLSSLNSNFGWNSNGLWFGYAAGGDADSYPVFTNFTMAQSDAVVVEFNVDWQDECSDIGVCIYLDGDTPRWVWGTDSSRISAQFDCLMPTIKGLTTDVSDTESQIPGPGMYHIRFIYNPAAADKVTLELFSGTNTDNLISTLALDEVLGSGNYRVGFAADNNGGRTYISDLSIMVNEDAPYIDTLQNGDSGSNNADVADFVFAYNGEASTMTIHNHDMEIRTTRDDEQDADISINSADDIWISAYDTVEISSETDEVVFYTNDHNTQWSFNSNGGFRLPNNGSIVNEANSSGDGLNASTIKIVPDSNLDSDQYLIIDPTVPNHIHIRAGGEQDSSSADLILGAEKTNVLVNDSAGKVEIHSKPSADGDIHQNINSEPGNTLSVNADLTYLLDSPRPGTNFVLANEVQYEITSWSVTEGITNIVAGDFTFDANGFYGVFRYYPSNEWAFDSNGYLYGPAEGYLPVQGLFGPQTDSDFEIVAPTTVVINGQFGEFLDNSADPNNQIATIGDLPTGATGSFVSQDGKTVTVTNGIITSIV